MSSVVTKYVKNKAKKVAQKAAETVASTVVGAVSNYGKKKKRKNKAKNKDKDSIKFMDPRNKMTFRDQTKYNSLDRSRISSTQYERDLFRLFVDPFGCRRGLRLAWDSSLPTAIMTLTYRGFIYTDVSGWLFTMLPSINYPLFYKSNTSVGPNAWSQSAVLFPSGLDVMSNVDSYRFISMGMKVRAVGSMASVNGIFSACTENTEPWATPHWDTATSSWKQTRNTAEIFVDPNRAVTDMVKPAIVTWHPHFANEFNFQDQVIHEDMHWNTHFSQCSIGIHAASSGQTFEVEMVGHVEWFPTNYSGSVLFDLQTADGTRDSTEKVIRRLRDNTHRSGQFTTRNFSVYKSSKSEIEDKPADKGEKKITISEAEYLELQKQKAKI